MKSRRPIRPDQHGTQTGYQYGCRDACCRAAHRAYRTGRRADRKELGAPGNNLPRGRSVHDEAIDALLELLHPLEGL